MSTAHAAMQQKCFLLLLARAMCFIHPNYMFCAPVRIDHATRAKHACNCVPVQDSCWQLASLVGSSAESGLQHGSRSSNNSSSSSSNLTKQLALAAADMQGQQLTSKIARYRALTLSKG
jgi:hypothetical protein